MVSKDDEAEAKFKTSGEQVHLLEDRLSKEIKQLVEKNASSSRYWKRVAILGKELTNASARVARSTTQDIVDSYLLDGVCNLPPLCKKASQQRSTADAGDRETLFSDKGPIDTEFLKFRKDM